MIKRERERDIYIYTYIYIYIKYGKMYRGPTLSNMLEAQITMMRIDPN